MAAARGIHEALQKAGLEVMLDDRDVRPGFKFKDADLVGIPLRITLGTRGLAEGVVELKHRREADSVKVPIDDLTEAVCARVRSELLRSTPD